MSNTTSTNTLPIATLIASFGPDLEFAKEMASMTSYRTGGKAKYYISVRSSGEITRAVKAAEQLGIPHFILGGGTNLLVSDDGFDGVIIKVDVMGMTLETSDTVRCGAGEQLMALVDFATEHGLSGLEFAAGIWGTVGGAIYGNAGAFGGEIGPITRRLTLVDDKGVVCTVDPDYCRFGYRDSHLKTTHEVVVDALFGLTPGDRATISGKVKEILAARDGKHPVDGMSAGCFFKNIPDPKEKFGKLPAGRLLEEIGAKGMSVGGAKVFDKHANIIVNTGTATSKEIRQLADILKEKVKARFGIELQEEVIQLGRF
ncbi:UDP-N-acetylenolpyruvoylglucosamine reductase [candidate division GN15 bacterium]|uniref:UDP-N-acetylenolpyruvoylglucosamine reductase n=1 Tax=candidate division GN15 bacterium TaxID=2072418 RepID=A0A855X1V3_9BACT|nr:MAG: UDP-N-acetylenolpyruvoylglucosamine reductase [candidate division GN15 bacterium]